MPNFPAPSLRHLCDVTADLAAPIELGDAPGGRKRIIPIVGGTVVGERVRGKIMNLGADWQTIFSDGVAELDTRYAFVTDDGATIEIRNFGFRHGPAEVIAAVGRGEDVDPSAYYMRTQPRFFTGDPRYAWMNRILSIGTGARRANSVVISLYEVL